MWQYQEIERSFVVPTTTPFQLIWQHHFAFITVLPCYRMPSLNFVFRDLDVAAVHLSAIVRTLTGSGLHEIVYYFPK
jgi:hypothetical protein